jgi:hypothetical protein
MAAEGDKEVEAEEEEIVGTEGLDPSGDAGAVQHTVHTAHTAHTAHCILCSD